MNEYGYGGFRFAPWARNPYLSNRGAGGSSNGSASAVAGSLAVFSLGTDGGGSIRIPAAMCNLNGLAPTPGRIDGSGQLPPAGFGRLRRVGPLCRSAEDALIVDSVLVGGGEWPEEPPRILGRLAAVEDHIRLDGDLRGIYENALETMGREMGAEITDIDIPGFAEASRINWTFLAYNAWDRFGEFVMERRDKATPELIELIERGRDISERELEDALIFRRRFIADTRKALKKVGAIVTPTRPMAQRLEEAQDNSVDRPHANPGGSFTAPFNLAEFPALAFPCGFTADGAPIGIQLAGARNSDRSLLQLAAQYQRITGWHRKPPEYIEA